MMKMCLDRKDETPLSTMKFGSDTLDEEQEKDEFFRVNIPSFEPETKIDRFFWLFRISNKAKAVRKSIMEF